MPSILKTWPSSFSREHLLEVFNHKWAQFYFTLGKGRPKEEITELWYTHRGEIIGYFKINTIVRNLGNNLPKLESISGETSEWQIKLMNFVAVCDGPFIPAPERTYHESFRGWRYFDFLKHASSPYSKVRI